MDDILHRGYPHSKDVNIVVLGVANVGKSAIIVRFLTRRFIGDYDTRTESTYSHTTLLDSRSITMQIMDTTLTDPFQNEDAIKWGDGFIVVYSVTDKSSFKAAKKFAEDVRTIKIDAHIEIPIAVVGNKSDLLHLKQVSDANLEKLGRELNCPCFQVSASDGYANVVEPFLCICRQVRQINRQKEKLRGFLQKPSVSSKLRIRQSLQKRFSDLKHRGRTSTM